MSATTSTAYDWLRHIPRSLLELDNAPLFGESNPFPWEAFAKSLAVDLRLEGLTLEVSDTQWLEKDQLFQTLGDDLVPLNIGISGLEGSICWVMPRDDLNFFASKLLESNEEQLDEDFQEGLYRFLGFQVLNTLTRLKWNNSLSIHILNKKELPAETSLCLDIKATWNERSVLGRLILSPAFQKAWKERFANKTLEIPGLSNSALADVLETTIHLEAGKTTFTLSEWETVKEGDFVLLDSCSLKEEGKKGRIALTIKGIPFCTGRLKDGGIKIVEHPAYREVDATMANEPLDGEETEFEEDFEDFEEEEEIVEEESSEGDEFEEVQEEEELPESNDHVETAAAAVVKEEVSSPKDIPMAVVVEVGRLKMSIKKLMELQPGNILDLNIHPEDGVDLTINGKCVAKGELLKVGETLGVRILDIG